MKSDDLFLIGLDLVKDSKFPGLNPDWADVAKSGVIGLQDHGNDVWYRNIKILEQ